jgi:hypothetical protein
MSRHHTHRSGKGFKIFLLMIAAAALMFSGCARGAQAAAAGIDNNQNQSLRMKLAYASYYGVGAQTNSGVVAADAAGNLYLAGTQYGPDNTTFLTKFLTTGAIGYSFRLHSGVADQVTALAVDGSGNIYIAGQTTSSDFPVTADGFQRSLPASTCPGQWSCVSGFVVEIAADGSHIVHGTFLGGSGPAGVLSLAIGGAGEIVVTGENYLSSMDFPLTSPSSGDCFIAVLDANLDRLSAARLFGGSGGSAVNGIPGDMATSVAVATNGDVLIGGATSSTDFPTTAGAYQTHLRGTINAFVMDLTNAGVVRWSTLLGGSGSERASNLFSPGPTIATAADGSIWMTGATTSGDFPTTAGALSANLHGADDAFVAHLSGDGAHLLYSTYLGGSGDEAGNAVAVAFDGTIWIAGATTSGDFPFRHAFEAFVGATVDRPPSDAYVAALSPNGRLLFSSPLGGSGYDNALSLVLGSSGPVVAGVTTSTDFPITPSAAQPNPNGIGSLFVASLRSIE